MRPLKLELEGFSAFRERAEVDFADAELFVFTGTTGSGKSSLIDAMTFALYGSVPRYDDKRLVAAAITQGKTEARLRFDFTLGETEYTAVRVVKRTKSGGATTAEARLQRGEQVLAATADEVTEVVTKLLGLDFEQFTRCVVLPQGDFAEFLHDKPASRQKLLTRLLGIDLYQVVRGLAVERESTAKGAVAALQGQLESMVDSTPAALKTAATRIGKLEKLKESIEAALPGLVELDGELEATEGTRKTLAAEIARLQALAVPKGIADLGKRLAAATETDALGAQGVEKAETALEAARAARDALGDPDALKEALRNHEALETATKELAGAQAKAKSAGAAAKKSEAATAGALKDVESARQALEAVRRAHAAQHLAEGLKKGDDCPVCLQPVAKTPKHATPDGITQAESALKEAEGALRDARDADSQSKAADSVARAAVERVQGEIVKLTAKTKDAPGAKEIKKTLAAIDTAGAAVAKAETAFKTARTAATAARTALDAARSDQSRALTGFDTARDGVASLDPPAADRENLAGSWKALVDWAGKKTAEHAKQVEKATAQLEKLGKKQEKGLQKLSDACEKLEVEFNETAPRDGVVDALAQERQEHDRIERDLARSAALRKEAEGALTNQKVAAELAKHLKSTGFERWLLAEAMDRLVVKASTMLHEISGEAYSFARDKNNNFEVIDHRNADETRSVKTLSGGETFLASLALALSLVDHVAEMATAGSARLESIFLDEGFGSLDPHTLDVVASSIEELAAGDRVVGLVTHVRELADRIPVQFRVTKGPSTATVERVTS